MSNTTDAAWTHNTLDAITAAEYAVEAAREALEHAHQALSEAHGTHRAVEEVAAKGLSWDDALEELNDDPAVGDYAFAEAILRHDRGEPTVAGVDVAHLTPVALDAIHELTRYATDKTKVELVTLVAQADDPVAAAEALQKRLVDNGYGYDVLAA